MHYPSFKAVLEYSCDYSLIPIRRTVWSDNCTPIGLFQRVKNTYSFLLESVEGGEKWARYSFIGNQPFLLFYVKEGKTYLQHDPHHAHSRPEKQEGDPLEILQGLLHQYKVPAALDFPRFTGGAVGYIGYDAISFVEDIPNHGKESLGQDDMRLMFCDQIIAFDHVNQEITFIDHMHVSELDNEQTLRRKYAQVCQRLDERVDRISAEMKHVQMKLLAPTKHVSDVNWEHVQSNFTKQEFMAAVEAVKEYIRAGDVFQTVLSQRFSVDINTEPFNIYRVLRSINPSPYLYYLDLGDDHQIVGSSPERLVKVEEGMVETNPIAGTRKRGATREEDDALAEELLADEKERAEHHMLLDLGRNDIGRIAKYGTVRVSKQMEIERFSHVMHIVSTVEGEVEEKRGNVDSLFSCFPAGTVSGAPKIRAMEIIAELEPDARHAYAGAIGYFSFSQNLDSCITIRTIMIAGGKAHVQAGAGIVADSVPENEWMETCNKAQALLVAIQMAEDLFDTTKKGADQYA